MNDEEVSNALATFIYDVLEDWDKLGRMSISDKEDLSERLTREIETLEIETQIAIKEMRDEL